VFDPRTALLLHFLEARAAEAEGGAAGDAPWTAAREAVDAAREGDADLAAAIEVRDAARLRGILEEWRSGKRALPEHDRDLLKRAMRAFRKRLRLTLLDDESSSGRNPVSSGRSSGILGLTPPREFPREVWLELARQGRLRNAGQGIFELPPGKSLLDE